MISLIERVSRNDPKCMDVTIPCSRNYGVPNNDITQDVLIRLVEAMKQNRYVRNIDFFYARRFPELYRQLAALFYMNTVIQCIGLPAGTSNEELIAIEESLRNNTSVTSLNLCVCDIRGRQGGEIIQRLRNGTIEEIRLSDNPNLGADGAVGLAQALRNEHCVLKKLDLSFCGIGNDGARELSNAIGNNNVLEELRIWYNTITFTGLCHIVEMLETNSCLRILDLRYNKLDQDRTGHETTAGDLLARGLQRNASLRELGLSNCCLSAADLSCVFQTLAGDNQTLACLSIEINEMDDASAKTFARCLPEWKGLRDVLFSWYEGVSETVLREFLEGLLCNKSLVRIRAWGRLQGEGSQALWDAWSTFVVRRNRMRPLLEGNGEASGGGRRAAGRPAQPVPASLWPSVLKWCCRNDRGQNGFSLKLLNCIIFKNNGSTEEEGASLIHHVLCTRANDIIIPRLGEHKTAMNAPPHRRFRLYYSPFGLVQNKKNLIAEMGRRGST